MSPRVSRYAPLALRLGIAVVFLWFGFSLLASPASWTRMVPSYVVSFAPFSTSSLVYTVGAFELVAGTMLLLGICTRVVSLVLALHLVHIVSIVGYGPVGARDLALALATFSIFLRGSDEFCLDVILRKQKQDMQHSDAE